jgi:glycopeptide antibiotics resistance protein
MPPVSRSLLVYLVAMLGVWLVVPILHSLWFVVMIDGRIFTSSFGWFSGPAMLQWLFYVLVFCPFGYLVARFAPVRTWWLSSAMFGVLYGISLLVMSQDYFVSESAWSNYVWVYGAYVMPVAGALIGAVVYKLSAWRTADH